MQKSISLVVRCGMAWDAAGSVTLRFSARRHCCQALMCPASDHAVAFGCTTRTVSQSCPALSGCGSSGSSINCLPCGATSRGTSPLASGLPSSATIQCRSSLSL
ncbi:hypothetical protein OG1X_1862 [Enterococcus faecalis OG1X]|nr:hypothetical protein OG1X_1862 [Enterococcus faecalis OG1X]